jgi:hypothetical protein
LRGSFRFERFSDFVTAPDLDKIKCKAFCGANAVLECVEVIRPWGRLDFVAAPDLLKIKHKALDRAGAIDGGLSNDRGWETRSVNVDLLCIRIDEPGQLCAVPDPALQLFLGGG